MRYGSGSFKGKRNQFILKAKKLPNPTLCFEASFIECNQWYFSMMFDYLVSKMIFEP